MKQPCAPREPPAGAAGAGGEAGEILHAAAPQRRSAVGAGAHEHRNAKGREAGRSRRQAAAPFGGNKPPPKPRSGQQKGGSSADALRKPHPERSKGDQKEARSAERGRQSAASGVSGCGGAQRRTKPERRR